MGRKISEIEVLDAEKRRAPSKHYVYVILVTWADGSSLTVFRRYSRFFDLQTKLLDLFPVEGGIIDPQKRVIPFLPGKIFFGRSHVKDVAMKRMKDISEYCKSLIKLPSHISECEDVLEFFEVEPEDLDPPSANPEDGKSKSSKEKKAEKISKPKRLARYVAVAEYTVQASGEIALQPGMTVEVLEKSDSGWWFVNSEDEQGWAPSTYLEPESDTEDKSEEVMRAKPGSEEKYLCIEDFTAAGADEISLEKGAVVEVVEKSMDGWWLVSYQGRVAYAPGTYLKKATNAQSKNLADQARLSGVQIISSLQDVSNLLNKEETKASNSQSPSNNQASSDVVKKPVASAVVKQRSLERGGSLNPPPRQNSITKIASPTSQSKSNIYVTIEAFEDTVGDGLSFKQGEKVYVKEKTTSGWWFVALGQEEGWVPSSYLESCTDDLRSSSVYELASSDEHGDPAEQSDDSDDSDKDYDADEDWYVTPDSDLGRESQAGPIVIPTTSPDLRGKRPLPPIPPEEDQEEENKPAAQPKRFAARPLPPPPAPPVESESKADTPALPPSVPTVKPSLPAVKPNVPKAPYNTVAKATSGKPKPQLPDPASQAKPGGGGSGGGDLASVLKSKFEARARAAASSDEELEENKKSSPSVPTTKPTPSAGKVFPPALPSKPSDLRKSPRESSPQSSRPNIGSNKGFSKPPPPAKSKPTSAAASNSSATVDKPSVPLVPLKPVGKPELGKPEQSGNGTSNQDKNQGVSKEKPNVKAMTGLFNKPANPKPSPAGKPQPAVKPKPGVAVKPSIASKPSGQSSKPNGQWNKPSGQAQVNNLANSLSSKLNFGQSPASDVNQNNPKLKPKPEVAEKLPSSAPPSAPKPSSQGQVCVAVYDFTAENSGEISFCEGDELEILDEQDDWSLVRFYDDEGWAPTGYLKKE
ncbi:SH3 and PX domain-containing protein 2A isoform X2 [Aplysia californica]|uniref:SH3 and PX domain-containing protein 2A isoform X2 n=1 Tax=Aplysia californica TaxID=6500 RepID=A0ABM0JQ06_APLCA|nr:SH3 and PX domain-containing protein 2A isoform X2 [Aplysia californica]